MGYNEDYLTICKNNGIECAPPRELSDSERATSKDYAELEAKISTKIAENDRMMTLSQIYARYGLPPHF